MILQGSDNTTESVWKELNELVKTIWLRYITINRYDRYDCKVC